MGPGRSNRQNPPEKGSRFHEDPGMGEQGTGTPFPELPTGIPLHRKHPISESSEPQMASLEFGFQVGEPRVLPGERWGLVLR